MHIETRASLFSVKPRSTQGFLGHRKLASFKATPFCKDSSALSVFLFYVFAKLQDSFTLTPVSMCVLNMHILSYLSNLGLWGVFVSTWGVTVSVSRERPRESSSSRDVFLFKQRRPGLQLKVVDGRPSTAFRFLTTLLTWKGRLMRR